MIEYFILFFIILVLSLAGYFRKKKEYAIFIFFVLAFFSGFRYYVGTDFKSYEDIFNIIAKKRFDILFIKELGFVYITKFIVSIGGTAQLMFLFMAIMTQFFIYKHFKRFSISIYLSILIYFCIAPYYFASFNGVRQSAAIAVFVFSLYYIYEKKINYYFLLNIISAFFFHTSSLFMLPFYFFLGKSYSKWKKIPILIFILLSSLFIVELLKLTPYEHYVTLSREYKVQSSMVNYIFIIISIIVAFLEKYVIYNNKIKNIFFNMNIVSLGISLVALYQSHGTLYMLLMRINNYFFISYTILIPMLFYKSRFKNIVIVKVFVFIILVLYFIRTVALNGEHYMLVPYQANFKLFN